jgi:hypothetical protein
LPKISHLNHGLLSALFMLIVTRKVQRAFLPIALASACVAQTPKSVTFLRLSPQIVEQRLQPPAPSADWSDALRKQYAKAAIQPGQIVEQAVPSSSQKMLICTLKGRGHSVIVVSASLDRPENNEAKRNVAWASLAMLPLLAESLNSVSTESSIVFIAFPPDKHHNPASLWYAGKLSEAERKNVKAAIEISGVGRGQTSYEVKPGDRSLADWLAVAATSLRQPVPVKSQYFDSLNFADARAFRSSSIPAITISSDPQHAPAAWNRPNLSINFLDSTAYYSAYQTLCVFLIDVDRAARGESPRTSVAVVSAEAAQVAKRPSFTEEQASVMIARQIAEARDQYHTSTLWPGIVPDLHDKVCAMARGNQLDAAPFEALLKSKKLSGNVAVFSGDYPSLTPEQMQGLKMGRFHKLAVSTCAVPSEEGKSTTYWIAALAYE